MSEEAKAGDFADAGCGTCEWLQCLVCGDVNVHDYGTYVRPDGYVGFFTEDEIMRRVTPTYPSSRSEWLRLHSEPHTENPTKDWK